MSIALEPKRISEPCMAEFFSESYDKSNKTIEEQVLEISGNIVDITSKKIQSIIKYLERYANVLKNNFKRNLCENIVQGKYCPFRNKCDFAHTVIVHLAANLFGNKYFKHRPCRLNDACRYVRRYCKQNNCTFVHAGELIQKKGNWLRFGWEIHQPSYDSRFVPTLPLSMHSATDFQVRSTSSSLLVPAEYSVRPMSEDSLSGSEVAHERSEAQRFSSDELASNNLSLVTRHTSTSITSNSVSSSTRSRPPSASDSEESQFFETETITSDLLSREDAERIETSNSYSSRSSDVDNKEAEDWREFLDGIVSSKIESQIDSFTIRSVSDGL